MICLSRSVRNIDVTVEARLKRGCLDIHSPSCWIPAKHEDVEICRIRKAFSLGEGLTTSSQSKSNVISFSWLICYLLPGLPFMAILAVSQYLARRHILRHMRRFNNWSYRNVTDFIKENGFSFFEELPCSHERWVKFGAEGAIAHRVEVNFPIACIR